MSAIKNVVNKTTEQVKKPTIKSLQQEVNNLTKQLTQANKLNFKLGEDILRFENEAVLDNRDIANLTAALHSRDETILKLEVPFYRKIFNLFGN